VPPAERTFLEDQRSKRKMVIGTIDKQASEALRKKRIRTEKREQYYSKVAKLDEGPSTSLDHSSIEKYVSDSDSSNSDSASDDICENEESAITAKNMMPLPTLSRECDRYGVSNTVGAAIATATLTDYGIVTENDKTLAVDRSKLWRERERLRSQLSDNASQKLEKLCSIFLMAEKISHL